MAERLLVWVVLASAISRSLEFPAEQECPEECDCHYFRVNYVTDCSESNLTEIPYEEISLNVYILDMNGNQITEVGPFPEDMKVRRLQLAENKISSLTPEMFSGLKYMVDVDLSGNNITFVDSNSFRESHGLITVELQNNPLAHVDTGSFLKCKSLLYLDISNCGLSRLNGDFFTETPLLTYLDLSSNPFEDLESSVFRPLGILSELKLSACNLTNLKSDLLERQTHLKVLDLSDNRLTTVDWTPIFGHLPRLENLNLRTTYIKNLPENVFVNNTFLRVLILSNNELTDLNISSTLSENLINLHSLDLSDCRLFGPFDKTTFAKATNLKNLNLSGNRLSSKDLSLALNPLTKLTTLSLKHCSLSKLPSNIFENLVQLKELDISWNSLNNVFDDLLDSLKNLEYLNMGYSNLSELSRDTFLKTTNLKRLILSGNKLRELEAGLFKNLKELDTLEIENCDLEKPIDGNVFSGENCGYLRELKMAGNPLKIEEEVLFPENLCRLKVLDLSNCNLTYLPDECFNNTRNLTRLYLAGNKITAKAMSNTSFLNHLISLEYLDFSGNLLTKLPIEVIEKTQVRDVKLINNPWICDCTLADWWNWAIDKGAITHLIGSTLTPDDVTAGGNKRKKGLLCRIDSKVTPPGKKSPKKIRAETSIKTWARYLKESNCPLKKIETEQESDIPTAYPMHEILGFHSESLVREKTVSTMSGRFYAASISAILLTIFAGFVFGHFSSICRRRLSRRSIDES